MQCYSALAPSLRSLAQTLIGNVKSVREWITENQGVIVTVAKIVAMVNSQHALQPYASTLFNTISHDREVYGRIVSYLATMGIKAPGEINASDPANKEDLYYCGGTNSKTIDICK